MSTSDEEVFTIWTDDSGKYDASVVYLCGELDASTVPGFLSEIKMILNRNKNTIIDAHLLSYADSTGLAAILSIKNSLHHEGKELFLVGCHGVLAKILRITHADEDIVCFEDVDTAVEEIKVRQKQT